MALENERQLAWVSRHVGHSSIAVTDHVYAHFARAARRAEMAELEGAFRVA